VIRQLFDNIGMFDDCEFSESSALQAQRYGVHLIFKKDDLLLASDIGVDEAKQLALALWRNTTITTLQLGCILTFCFLHTLHM